MVAEAEKFSEEDKKKREEIDVRNTVCFPTCIAFFPAGNLFGHHPASAGGAILNHLVGLH